MNEPVVEFVLNNAYRIGDGDKLASGHQLARAEQGRVLWNGNLYDELLFSPVNVDVDSFTLQDVTIGVSFHWRRKEDQTFRGALKLIVENDNITAINVISVEDYLLSVISSEMSATASLAMSHGLVLGHLLLD